MANRALETMKFNKRKTAENQCSQAVQKSKRKMHADEIYVDTRYVYVY